MQISPQRQAASPMQSSSAQRTVTVPAARVSANGANAAAGAMEGPPPMGAQGPPPPDQMASNLARLDNFMESAMGRLQEAVADAPEGEVTSFREAAEALESGLSRIRDGIQNGTMMPSDIQRGVQNTFQGAREILNGARPADEDDAIKAMGTDAMEAGSVAASPGGMPAGPTTDTGEVVRSRYQGFTDSVLARVGGMEGMDDSSMAEIEAAASAFESATARLDQALFNPESGDSIDRGTYQSLYQDALSALQEQLTGLMDSGSQERGSQGSVIYNAQKGAESMTKAGFGLDVAG
ncbi:MAG: hypothetical protein ACJAZN_003251 [Planctomycetota bacterium]|jgi:hypothetical protein